MFLEADPALTTLLDFHYKRHYHAERGQHGKGANRHGASGDDLVLRVPLGTVVTDRDTRRAARRPHRARASACSPCAGARGGRGNARFAIVDQPGAAPRRSRAARARSAGCTSS